MTNGIRKEWGKPGQTSPVIDAMTSPREFAMLIRADWKKPTSNAASVLAALATMDSIHHYYGSLKGVWLVETFLLNASSWRGPIARNVKARLNQLIKEAK
jgi:hypothetical protein